MYKIWMFWSGKRKPPVVKACIESVRRHHSNVVLLDKMPAEFPFRKTSRGLPWSTQADMLRWWLLYEYGGMWLDCDVLCYRTLPLLYDLLDHDFVLWKRGDGYKANIVASVAKGVVISDVWETECRTELRQRGKIRRMTFSSPMLSPVVRAHPTIVKAYGHRRFMAIHADSRIRKRWLHECGDYKRYKYYVPDAYCSHLTHGVANKQPAGYLKFAIKQSKKIRTLARTKAIIQRTSAGGHLVEVGAFDAKNAYSILTHRPNLRMTLVDTWAEATESYAASGDKMASLTAAEWDKLYKHVGELMGAFGDRVTILRMPSVEAAQYVDGADYVFIDADHSYNGVRADLEAWTSKASRWIGGHDYDNKHEGYDVVRAVNEKFENVRKGPGSTWFVSV